MIWAAQADARREQDIGRIEDGVQYHNLISNQLISLRDHNAAYPPANLMIVHNSITLNVI